MSISGPCRRYEGPAPSNFLRVDSREAFAEAISTEKLVEWGTHNGAKFLGIDNEIGTLEPGKTPGLNLITGVDGLMLTPESKVKRLI